MVFSDASKFKAMQPKKTLEPHYFTGANFNIVDMEKFKKALELLQESLFDKGATLYASDNIITWNRNLSFLRDDYFIRIIRDEKNTGVEKSILWRLYVLLYFAEMAGQREGDFVELGCHTGFTAGHVVQKVDFKKLGKKYYLYDLFEWKEGDKHTHLPGHDNKNMYEEVKARFASFPFVRIIKGSVPESLSQGFPEKIAFAHIDMNHPDPEVGALERVLPILSSGGVIIFDDYGWWGYSAQKMALDPIIERNGLKVLELPTGQGLLIKP